MIKSKRPIYAIIFLISGFLLVLPFAGFVVLDANAENLKPAPNYSAVTLEGESISLSDLSGKVVLINVWATWCEPCREEMPELQKLQNKFSNTEFVIVGVSIDEKGYTQMIRNFLQSQNISYTAWHDPDNRFQYAFRTIGVPESVLISKDGVILHQWKGVFDPMSENTISRVETALQEIEFVDDGTISTLGSNIGVRYAIAFSAGLLSFLSPCILPLIPAYTSFITGMSLKELSSKNIQTTNSGKTQSKLRIKTTVLSRGSMFVLGFSIVFITLGITVSYASSFFVDAATWIERIGGIIIIAFGLHLLGILNIKKLNQQKSFDFSKRSTKNVGSILVGMAFGAGWTPCIGPILAGILTIAATSSTVNEGALLLGVYSIGLAIPFILSALAIDQFLVFFQKIKRWIGWIERISGIMLIGIGVLLLTGSLTVINSMFSDSIVPDLQNDEFI